MPAEFKNELVLDFSQESNRKKQSEALALVQSQLGREYDLIIGAERLKSDKTFKSINPSKKSEVVGIFQSADREQAIHAIGVAVKAFEKWKTVSAQERADVLFRAADFFRYLAATDTSCARRDANPSTAKSTSATHTIPNPTS